MSKPSPDDQTFGHSGRATSPSASEERRRLGRVSGRARLLVGVILVGLVVFAVVRQWEDVRETVVRISPFELAVAELLALAGLAASAMTWRLSLRELGSETTVPAASKIYLIGQLAKYLPGSFWVLPAQMELASLAGVPRVRALIASTVAVGINAVTGFAVGCFALPAVSDGIWPIVSAVVVGAACAAALTPPLLTRLLNAGLRVIRRPGLERDVSWRGVLGASGWSLSSWASYGMSVWVLAVAIGAPAAESLALCVAGMALAITIGFVVVLAPSGIGVREAVLVAALAPVLEPGQALAIALVARLLFTVADLVAAAVVVPIRLRPPI